jgi:hypothetical protein
VTQPTPTPAPAPTSGSFGGITLTVPSGGTSTSSGPSYGLGSWGGQNVDPGDLPFLADIIATGGQTTGNNVMKAFLSAPAGQVATIQHALLMGGYYSKTTTPKWGVISPEDRDAFARAITIAGQAGESISSTLESAAAYGATAGLEAAKAQTLAAKHVTVSLPNATDLESLAVKAFQATLGRKATPQEAARFAASYRAMSGGAQRAAAQAAYQAQTGVAPVTGDPLAMVQQAITNPQANNPALGSKLSHELGTGGNPSQPPLAGSFDQQIGGLMQLGQQQVAPGSAARPGLTETVQNQQVSPDVAAENYARNTHPQAAAATDFANTFNTFLSLLNGVSGVA